MDEFSLSIIGDGLDAGKGGEVKENKINNKQEGEENEGKT